MSSPFFRKFYAMMETGKRVRTKGLSRRLVGQVPG